MSLSFSLRGFSFCVLVSCSALLAACGEELTDGDFGGVDLQAFYYDTAGLAPPVDPMDGWINGKPAKYYDFGWAAATRDTADPETRSRLAIDHTVRIPKVAPVNPMFFFFDQNGNPLTVTPMLEKKTGYFVMPGGKGVRNVNPAANAIRDVAYPVRRRDFFVDPNRKVPDYQRPIIDVIYDRYKPSLEQRYTGLWEVVQVTVPSGYEPDTLKSWETLEKGWADGNGDYKLNYTEKVINCPLTDLRSQFIPSVSAFEPGEPRMPQPRVELWYRRKRVDCFLVNGWPTLGEIIPKGDGNDEYRLYKANTADNAKSFSVLDTDRFVLGDGSAEKRQVVAPLGQLFVPTLSARSEEFYLTSFVTGGALPKRKSSDPPGYRPVRWWWNIAVTDVGNEVSDGYLISAGLTDPRNIDTSRLTPRNLRTDGVVVNFALTSQQIPCKGATPENDPCRALGLTCSLLQDQTTAFCEETKVRYGEVCGPTIAQCRDVVSQQDNAERWFNEVGAAEVPKDLPEEWRDGRKANFVGVRHYRCLADPTTELGHCYLGCNGSQANVLQGEVETINVTTRSGRQIDVEYKLDSRCGGRLMPGYRCMPVRDATNERGGSWCLRDCQSSEGQDVTDAVCAQPALGYFSDSFFGKDTALNTRCLDSRLFESVDANGVKKFFTFDACVKDVAYSPFAGE